MFRNNLLICSLALATLIGFFISFLAHGLVVSLTATCAIYKPWWSSKTRARADVTWIHPTTGPDLIVPHQHRVDYSLSARVGDQKPDKIEDHHTFMSSKRFTQAKRKTAYQTGVPRWDGDAYASSSISVQNDQDNWRFCAKPEP